ncbi:hypothetical protein M5K25_006277 [Dendrobium thyrsiflorum]|uniref:Retrovirus-related Pol polyprotein from transposon TNT 1-94 n=1 Tax=Dendrobium thyrsiflorum TaxID=117978 RepID=A0ABD0VB80_DENTH
MKQLTMTEYLIKIKTLVDKIAVAGANIDQEDIILYILNGLPPAYQAFKMLICTMLHSVSLDDLHSVLLCEEINLEEKSSRHQLSPDPNIKLYSLRGRGWGATESSRFTIWLELISDNDESFCTPHHSTSLDGHFGNQKLEKEKLLMQLTMENAWDVLAEKYKRRQHRST